MSTTTSKLTLTIPEDEFEHLAILGLNTGNSVSDMLSMFVTDLVANPDNCSPAEDLAQGWYSLLLPDGDSPLTFPAWLKQKQYHEIVFCLFSSILSHIPQNLHTTISDPLFSDEVRLLQVEGLLDQALSGSDQPYDDAMVLSLGDFAWPVQKHIQQIFDTIESLYAQYTSNQNIEIPEKSFYSDIMDMFLIWKDTVLRY